MAKLSKSEIARIAENVVGTARDNALETTRDLDHGERYHGAFLASVRSICESLQSARECSEYGAAKPLTTDQARKVCEIAEKG